jgi:uncharacterized protein (DUF736 family)
MSTYEQKDGNGSLFKNNEKEAETHADYRGSIKIGGVEYWLNAWIKKSAKGTTYMSLSAKPKEARPAEPARQAPPPDFDDSEIPF